ncbi:tetraacyldisaccharide 4'-kinase [Pelagibacteraceae bacterium]|nr:tetraacyldisaccharide 4'-kinase [Pelagibacteraceae bacterium]
MILNKPKFWDKKTSFFSVLLLPISLITLIVIWLKKKFTITKDYNLPIICVGNIYIGGTGKTPASILLAKELTKLGRKPVILRKYYINHVDEHNLIKKSFKNLILNKCRVEGIKEAEKSDYDSIILDDGLQDYKIRKDLNIVCFNQKQLIGNGLVLPSGPLRENLNTLKNATIVLINGRTDKDFEKKILNINLNLEIFYSHYKPLNLDQFKNKKLLAIAGIANPNNFFQLLEKNNLNIEEKLIFPDHYRFTKSEIKNIVEKAINKNYQIIMTEKDYFKIKDFKIDKIGYLKVSLEINEKDKFIKRINKIYDKKN